jgi:tRNA threonylcarbamoyl adenosine modification protein YeaZ
MRLLSFDSSSRELSVAVYDGHRLLDARKLSYAEEGARVAQTTATGKKKVNRQETVSQLIPTIDGALRAAGFGKHELEAICVGIGPGSFTGIRVAVVTARTFAQVLGLPLIGISSLEAAAYALLSDEVEIDQSTDSSGNSRAVGVVLQASTTHVFYGAYALAGGANRALSEEFENNFVQPQWQVVVAPGYIALDAFSQLRSATASQVPIWYAEEKSYSLIAGACENLQLGQFHWPLNNVAETQGKLALLRLSLTGDRKSNEQVSEFSYLNVLPMYLRGASVTLKSGDAIQRVESH